MFSRTKEHLGDHHTMANSATTTTSAGAERRKADSKLSDGEIRLNGAAAAAQTAKESEQKEHDFFWTYTEEPHRTRRLAIIKAHPEVTLSCQGAFRAPMSSKPSRIDKRSHYRSPNFAAQSH